MPSRFSNLAHGALPILAMACFVACGGPQKAIQESLRQHVLFFANFDKGVDALDCVGQPLATFDTANTHLVSSGGHPDGYLDFSPEAGALSYAAEKNFPYQADQAWSGGVAFWLGLDTTDLGANYPEPFHIGKRDASGYLWDDAVIFVDIKKSEQTLRFGCYPDKTQEITDQMVADRVITTPISSWKPGEWHHIAITWSNFNSHKADAEWALFVDGVEVGHKGPMRQDVTWDMSTQSFRFNHYKFPGRIDEVAVFNKQLTPGEVKYLVNPSPKAPLNELFYKKNAR